MDSVIQGLPNLSGYLKSQNLVVPVTFPWKQIERQAVQILSARVYEGEGVVHTGRGELF
jgi:hypothetical protein